jgi:hypothetical protein
MNIDAYTCLVFTAEWNAPDSPSVSGWTPGPLLIPLPSTSTTIARGGAAQATDRDARTAYFAPRVHDLLYGPPPSGERPPRRWHRDSNSDLPDPHGSRIQAWEMLAHGPGRYLIAAHVQLGPDAASALSALSAIRGDGREWLQSAAGPPVQLDQSRPRVLSHLRWEGDQMPEPYDSPAVMAALEPWTTVQRWQWFLASGVGPDAVLPDTADPDILDGQVRLSRDWRAQVLRDGIAYVALTPRPSPSTGSTSFHDLARVYIRSIYLDLLLLGIIQLDAVNAYADAFAAVHIEHDSVRTAKTVEELEVGLLRLRTGVWWRDVARRGGPSSSSILTAFQRQHRLPELYTQITADLTDMSRYVQARRANAEEAERQAREQRKDVEERVRQAAEDRQQQTERAIALISFVLLPASLIFGAAALWSDPSPIHFWISIGFSIFVLALMLGLSATLRSALFRRRKPLPGPRGTSGGPAHDGVTASTGPSDVPAGRLDSARSSPAIQGRTLRAA